MQPKPRAKLEYEKVRTDDWTQGIVEDIQLEENRKTGFKDEETGEEIIKDCVRFKFKLDGYDHPHYSNWMSFSYHEKAGLFLKYICSLVKDAKPDMTFNLERIKGMGVKVMWADKGEYQRVEMVRPLKEKLDPSLLF